MKKIKVAIAGVGNCASALVQGVEYYRTNRNAELDGVMRQNIGGHASHKTNAGRRGLAGSFAGAALVFAMWITVRHASSSIFTVKSVDHALQAACLLALSLGVLMLVGLALNGPAFRNLRIAVQRPVNVVRV